MKVNVMDYTRDPMLQIAMHAGTSTARRDPSWNRVTRCYKQGHMGVFEHAYVTFYVEGISRNCSHQLVRHRHASFVEESQRYCKVNVDGEWYVVPESVDASMFTALMERCAVEYTIALEDGVKPEDARYILPGAAKTNITVTMNVRELFHFLDQRTDAAAQWEIRQLALMMLDMSRHINDEWAELMQLWVNDNEERLERYGE